MILYKYFIGITFFSCSRFQKKQHLDTVASTNLSERIFIIWSSTKAVQKFGRRNWKPLNAEIEKSLLLKPYSKPIGDLEVLNTD